MTYIAILRGINVSGQKMIKMAELKDLFTGLKCTNVRTYIQSGNVIFESAIDAETLEKKIEKQIEKVFGFEVPVLVRSVEEMKKVLEKNPFLKDKKVDPEKLHVTFLSEVPSKENIEATNKLSFEPDQFILAKKEVYVHCPDKYGTTKINNTFFEKKLKVTATTRNLKTVKELIRIGEE